MKRLLAAVLLLCAVGARAADLTSGVNTPNGQGYSQGYRDIKDGTNATTRDVVTANSYASFATTTTVKSTAGYLEGIQFWKACAEVFLVIDGATLTSGVAISTVPASLAQQYVPYKARFNTALTIGVPTACASGVTVSYR